MSPPAGVVDGLLAGRYRLVARLGRGRQRRGLARPRRAARPRLSPSRCCGPSSPTTRTSGRASGPRRGSRRACATPASPRSSTSPRTTRAPGSSWSSSTGAAVRRCSGRREPAVGRPDPRRRRAGRSGAAGGARRRCRAPRRQARQPAAASRRPAAASPTSASPTPPAPRRSRAPVRWSAPRPTCPRSRRPDGRSPAPPTSTRSVSWPTSACTGTRPFERDDPVAVLLAHLRSRRLPLPPEVPGRCADLVAAGVAKDPAGRGRGPMAGAAGRCEPAAAGRCPLRRYRPTRRSRGTARRPAGSTAPDRAARLSELAAAPRHAPARSRSARRAVRLLLGLLVAARARPRGPRRDRRRPAARDRGPTCGGPDAVAAGSCARRGPGGRARSRTSSDVRSAACRCARPGHRTGTRSSAAGPSQDRSQRSPRPARSRTARRRGQGATDWTGPRLAYDGSGAAAPQGGSPRSSCRRQQVPQGDQEQPAQKAEQRRADGRAGDGAGTGDRRSSRPRCSAVATGSVSASAPAAWPTSARASTCGSAGRSPSRCCGPTSRATRPSRRGSAAKRRPPRR